MAARGEGIRCPAGLAAGAVAIWLVAGPAVAHGLEGATPAAAGVALAGLLALVGIPMGMPFPRLLAAWRAPSGVAAAWAASGIAAVAVGAGSLWLGHAAGVSSVGIVATLAYATAAAVHPPLPSRALDGSTAQAGPIRPPTQANTSASASGGV